MVGLLFAVLGWSLWPTLAGAQAPFQTVGADFADVTDASVDWGDFDNDGDQDVVVAGNYGSLDVYENVGGGSFNAIETPTLLVPERRPEVAWGDFNGDGNLDLAVAADTAVGEPPVTKVYEGGGDGSFTELAVGSGLTQQLAGVEGGLAWGDYNNDGYDDLAVAGADTAVVYPGEAGGLGSGIGTAVLTEVSNAEVAFGDFNGDGYDDLALLGDTDLTVTGTNVTEVYQGSLSGFSLLSNVTLTRMYGGGLDWGDYNNDGNLDLLVSGYDRSITGPRTTVYAGDGNGGFTQAFTVTGVGYDDADWGDYDGDGNLDFVTTGGGSGLRATRVYRGDGSGNFAYASGIGVADADAGDAQWADYNGDGTDELLVTGNQDFGSPDALLYQGVPFALTNVSPAPGARSVPRDEPIVLNFTTDVDAPDGDDVVVQGSQSGRIQSAASTGEGSLTYQGDSFAPGEEVAVTIRGDSLQNPALLSVNNTITYEFTVEGRSALAEFPMERSLSTNEGGARAVAVGDLDGDGDRDLVVGADGDGTVSWYENSGGEEDNFGEGTQIDESVNNARDVLLADLTGNGDPDIVVAEGKGSNSSDDAVTWYENRISSGNGISSGTAVQSSSPLDDPRAIAAGDVDGDGDVDLVTASFENDRVVLHENQLDSGNGFSTSTINNQSGVEPRTIDLADLDGNGTLDVLVGEGLSDEVNWYSNDGTGGAGAFSGPSVITTNQSSPTEVHAVQFDSDRTPEVLVASEGDDTVAWYDSTGSGWSLGGTISSSVGNASAVHPADVTGDGTLDVLTASPAGDSLSVFINQGAASFSTARTFSTSAADVQDLMAGDIDGDGRLDPVAASFSDNTVSYFPNRRDLSIVYVDQDAMGAGDGTSWADAFPSLQDALTLAGVGDTVAVAAGTYHPDHGVSAVKGDRTVSFILSDSLKLYGGFDGMEGDLSGNLTGALSNRDLEQNTTILSGDIDQDGTLAGNSYHVLVSPRGISRGTKVDGFTIRGGNANNASLDLDGDGRVDANRGGGMYVNGRMGFSNPILSNLVFRANAASDRGGGLFLDAYNGGEVSPGLGNVSFIGNEAASGGGLSFALEPAVESLGGASRPLIANAIFRGNVANGTGTGEGRGGAVFFEDTDFNIQLVPLIVHSTIANNQANQEGGGIAGQTTGAIVQNSVLSGNTANGAPSQVSTADVDFQYSLVQGSGGSGTDWSLAATDGGGNIDVKPLFVDAAGGDLRLNWASPVIEAGTTHVQLNESTELVVQDSVDVNNNGDLSEPIPVDRAGNDRTRGGSPDMGAYEGGVQPSGTTTLYVDATSSGDAGNSGGAWTSPYRTLQAALAAARNERATTEGLTFREVQIAQGVYYPDEGPGMVGGDETASFQLFPNGTILGGYPTGGGVRAPESNVTVLSGDVGQDDATNSNGVTLAPSDTVGNNSESVVSLRSNFGTATIDGFTITAGQADGGEGRAVRGGGVYVSGRGNLRLRNLRLQGNFAAQQGGGLFAFNPKRVRLSDSEVRGNEASIGGGISVSELGSIVKRTTFVQNRASRGGAVAFGGRYDSISVPNVLVNARVVNNTAAQTGGGVYVRGNDDQPGVLGVASDTRFDNDFRGNPAVIQNSVFNGNTAPDGGALRVATTDSMLVANSTFSNNTASNVGGAILVDSSALSHAYLQNTVIWGNTSLGGASGVHLASDAALTVRAPSILPGGSEGINSAGTVTVAAGDTINADPLFVDPVGADGTAGTTDDSLQVLGRSPALGVGGGADVPPDAADLDGDGNRTEPTPHDLASRPRQLAGFNGQLDAGAFEGAASPSVRINAPTTVGATTADLRGAVVSYAPSATATFEVEPSSGGSVTTVTPNETISDSASAVSLSGTASGLQPGTQYDVRLTAENGTRSATSAGESFTTDAAAPTVSSVSASGVLDSSATLNATINPGGVTTNVYFELVEQATGDVSVYARDTLATNLLSAQSVSLATPDTLIPGTQYDLTVSAANSADSVEVGPQSFSTLGRLRVDGSVPGRNSVSVDSALSQVELTFSRSLDPSTVSTDSVRVTGSQSGAFSGSVSLNAATLTYQLPSDADLKPGETVTVSLDEKIADQNGIPLGTGQTLTFMIAAASGPGTFSATASNLSAVGDGAADWGDYDEDGDLDLLVVGDGGNSTPTATLYENTASGFQPVNAGLAGVYSADAAWGDYDADGDLDIVVAGNDGSAPTLTIYENDDDTEDGFSALEAGLTGVEQGAVDWGDYDGDGDLDLVVAGVNSSGTPTATVYQNNIGGEEDGGFAPVGVGLTGVRRASVDWGDYDADGALDLAITGINSAGSPSTTIYENTPNGFSPLGSSVPDKGEGSVAWGDYDGDSDLDLVLSGGEPSGGSAPTTQIFENTTSGFSAVNAGLTGVQDSDVEWNDYDADGDPDLLVAGQADGGFVTTLYENDVANGNGFSAVRAGFNGADGGEVDWGDYDGDGDMDFVVTGLDNRLNPSVTLYQQAQPLQATGSTPARNALGVDTSRSTVTISFNQALDANSIDPSSVSLTGSQSGRIPVSSAGLSGGSTLALQPGQNFQPGETVTVAALADSIAAGSGALLGSATSFRFTTQPASGPLSFPAATANLNGVTEGASDVGDVNGDGILDLIVTGSNTTGAPSTTLYLGNGDGTFSVASQGLVDLQNGTADFVDADRDGDLDLLLTGSDGTNPVTRLYVNELSAGGFGFAEGSSFLPGVQNSSVAFSDFDGDGDPDLFLTGQGVESRLAILARNAWKEDGTLSFGERLSSSQLVSPVTNGAVGVADVDGDNDSDLLVTGSNQGTPSITLYKNDGSGAFAAATGTNLSTAFTASTVSFGDIDGNGTTDLVLTGYAGGVPTTTLYTNDGSGTFSAAGQGLTGIANGAAELVDLQGDGDLDLLVSGDDENESFSTTLYTNDGTGSFTAQDSDLPDLARSVAEVADLDGDGDLDVFLGGDEGEAIVGNVYLNQGAPTIAASAVTVDEGGQSVIGQSQLEVTDAESDPSALQYTVDATPSNGILQVSGTEVSTGGTFTQADVNNGNLTYVHDGSETTSDSFTFTVGDQSGTGLTTTGTLSVTVSPVNDPPTISTSGPFSIEETASAGSTVGDVDATDGDGGDVDANVTYAIVGGNDPDGNGTGAFTIGSDNGQLQVGAAAEIDHEARTSYTLTVEASDAVEAVTQEITVNVTDIAPTIATQTVGEVSETVRNGTVAGMVVVGQDVTSISYSIVGGNPDRNGNDIGAFAVDGNGEVTVTDSVDLDYEVASTEVLNVEVSDGTVADTAAVTVPIANVNEAPVVATIADQSIREDSAAGPIGVAVSDPETATGDLSLTGTSSDQDLLPDGNVTIARTPDGPVLRAVPAADSNGTAVVTVTVSDGVNSVEETFQLTVEPVNDAPVARADSASVIENGARTIPVLANDTDLEGPLDSSSVAVVEAPASGETTVDPSGTVRYTPAQDYAGTDRFRYAVADQAGSASKRDTAAVQLTVVDVSLAVTRDTANFRASAVDTPGDTLAVQVVNDGEATLSGLSATIRAPENDPGAAPDDFQFVDGGSVPELAPTETATVQVAFGPTATGRRTAALGVTSAEGGEASAGLEGRGLSATLRARSVPRRGEAVSVDVRVDGGYDSGPDSLYVRQGGTESYEHFALQVDSSGTGSDASVRLSAEVPARLVTPRGIDAFAVLGGGVEQDPLLTVPYGGRSGARTGPRHLPVSFAEWAAPFRTQPQTYRMVSVPARPTDGIRVALEAAYGSYDQSTWRLMRWDPTASGNASSGAYREFPQLDSLRPGQGMWLITNGSDTLSVQSGQSVEADQAHTIVLESGWNQIGTPFGFAVPWAAVRAASGAEPAQIGEPVAYRSGEYGYGEPALRPWEGYFVYNRASQPDTLVIPPTGQSPDATNDQAQGKTAGPVALAGTGSLGAPARTPAQPLGRGSEVDEASSSTTSSGPGGSQTDAEADSETNTKRSSEGAAKQAGYTLRVTSRPDGADGTAGRPHRVWLGLRSAARSGPDKLDFAQAPPIGRAVQLSVVGSKSTERATRWAGNFKPSEGEGHSWFLAVKNRSTDATQTVQLRLRSQGRLPAGHAHYLLDLARDQRLVSGRKLSLKPGQTRHLKVLVGSESYAKQHSEGISVEDFANELRGNYPNPFAGETTIEYVLAKEQEVTVQVYNILGQQVRTLVDGAKKAGPHTLTWRGENRYGTPVGSGVYFYRIETENFTETRKMVLVR